MTEAAKVTDPKTLAEIAEMEARTTYLQAQTMREIRLAEKESYLAEKARLDFNATARAEAFDVASNINNRVYDFAGKVDGLSTYAAAATIQRWSRQSLDPITIRLSSLGGSVLDGNALYDTVLEVRDMDIEVTVIAFGVAASMASILLQSGTHRLMAPNSVLLIHDISSLAMGSIGELEDQMEFLKMLNRRGHEILASRSKLTVEEIGERSKRKDWWLSAQSSVELGFCDGIYV